MVDSNSASLPEIQSGPPSELGSSFLKTDEQTCRMTPEVTKPIRQLINAKKPHLELPLEILQGLAKIDQEEGDRRLTSLVDGVVAADETLMEIRSVVKSLLDTATHRMTDLQEEIDGLQKDRRGLLYLGLRPAPSVDGKKRNVDYVQLFFFLLLVAAIWFCFQTEWDNAVVVALNSSFDFGEELAEQKKNATLFVFCVVAMPAIIFKVIDLLLPWQLRTAYRLLLGSLAGMGVLALIYEWGMVAGGGHSSGGPMDSAVVANDSGLFFILQTGVFALGTFLLSLPAFWAWRHVQATDFILDEGRDACNQFAGVKVTERSGWIGLHKTAQELLDSIAGVHSKLLGTSRTWITNERKRFLLRQQAASTLQQFKEFELLDNHPPTEKEEFHSRNGSQPAS